MTAPLFQELFLDPVHESRAAGLRYGELIYLPWLTSPASGEAVAPARTSRQLEQVLSSMDAALGLAGAGRKEVARATFFMRDVYERPLLNEVWKRWYPEAADRPPHKYVPAQLPDGTDVALQVLAVAGGKRTVLEIPGLSHVDPMAMGARTDNLVTSSRLFGTLTELEAEIELVFDRVRILMEQAGGGVEEIEQATVFVGSNEVAKTFLERWESFWSGRSARPRTHLIVTDLGGGIGFPRIEIVGVLGRGNGEGEGS